MNLGSTWIAQSLDLIHKPLDDSLNFYHSPSSIIPFPYIGNNNLFFLYSLYRVKLLCNNNILDYGINSNQY